MSDERSGVAVNESTPPHTVQSVHVVHHVHNRKYITSRLFSYVTTFADFIIDCCISQRNRENMRRGNVVMELPMVTPLATPNDTIGSFHN